MTTKLLGIMMGAGDGGRGGGDEGRIEGRREAEREREAEMARREEEEYSDPDEGVEIVDMENVRQMDWMAPESLRKEKEGGKGIMHGVEE